MKAVINDHDISLLYRLMLKGSKLRLLDRIEDNNIYSEKISLLINNISEKNIDERDEIYLKIVAIIFKIDDVFYEKSYRGQFNNFLKKNIDYNDSNYLLEYICLEALIKIKRLSESYIVKNISNEVSIFNLIKEGEILVRFINNISIIICELIVKKRYNLNFINNLIKDVKVGNDNKDMYLIFLFRLYIAFYLRVDITSYERKFAHYTNVDIGLKFIKKITKLRLVSPDFMNDPSEGKILSKFLDLEFFCDENLENEEKNFFSCFTFNHDSLNQFRLYGRKDHIECSGMSLVAKREFFEDLENNGEGNFLRCIYLEPKTGYLEVASRNKWSFYQEYSKSKKNFEIELKYERYIKAINLKNENLIRIMQFMKEYIVFLGDDYLNFKAAEILNPLCYVFKNFSFKEEDECRFIKIEKLSNKKVKYQKEINSTYIECSLDIFDYIENIYIGVASKDLLNAIKIEVLRAKGKSKTKVKLSEHPYRAHKTLSNLN